MGILSKLIPFSDVVKKNFVRVKMNKKVVVYFVPRMITYGDVDFGVLGGIEHDIVDCKLMFFGNGTLVLIKSGVDVLEDLIKRCIRCNDVVFLFELIPTCLVSVNAPGESDLQVRSGSCVIKSVCDESVLNGDVDLDGDIDLGNDEFIEGIVRIAEVYIEGLKR